MPRVTEIRSALIKVIEDELLEWDDELEQPWINRDLSTPHRKFGSGQPTITTSAPAPHIKST